MALLKVFLVDDEYKAIHRLKDLLSNLDCIEVVGYATSYHEAISGISSKHPYWVFMDVEIRERSGFEVVKAINRSWLNPKIIFATGHNQYAIKALRSKAIDYLLKPIDLEELRESVDRVIDEGGFKFSTTLSQIAHDHDLTERETQILERLCHGRSSQEISEDLYLSIHTIDTYRRKLLKRFNVRNTQELMSVFLQTLMNQD